MTRLRHYHVSVCFEATPEYARILRKQIERLEEGLVVSPLEEVEA